MEPTLSQVGAKLTSHRLTSLPFLSSFLCCTLLVPCFCHMDPGQSVVRFAGTAIILVMALGSSTSCHRFQCTKQALSVALTKALICASHSPTTFVISAKNVHCHYLRQVLGSAVDLACWPTCPTCAPRSRQSARSLIYDHGSSRFHDESRRCRSHARTPLLSRSSLHLVYPPPMSCRHSRWLSS